MISQIFVFIKFVLYNFKEISKAVSKSFKAVFLHPLRVVFRKKYFSETVWSPVFWRILILFWVTSLLKIWLKFLKSFRRDPGFYFQYKLFLSIFWHFPVTKKLMTSHMTDDISSFHLQPTLNRLFNNSIKLYWY